MASGTPPSYEHLHANEGPGLDAVTIAVFCMAVIAVVLRFLTRLLSQATLMWDDFAILIALFFAIGPLYLTIYLVANDFGKHADVAGQASVLVFYKCLYVFEILYPLPIVATKFSILLFYRRIFQVQSFRKPFWIVAILIGCWLTYVEFCAIFTCVPISAVWDPTVKGNCIDISKFFIGIAVPNIVTDLALLALPLPYIWKLQKVPTAQKLAVLGVFILGGFVAVVSIIRLTALMSLRNVDATWTYVPTCMWTNIEVHIGIVSASLPALWPLLRACATGSFKSKSDRYMARHGSPTPILLESHQASFSKKTVTTDEEGFMQLKEVEVRRYNSSHDHDTEQRRADGQGLRKPERTASIRVWRDWSVSTEDANGRQV